MKKTLSKVAHIRPPFFFQYCQLAQNQPKSHFLFHKNVFLCDFYITTLAVGFGNSEILELLIENGADVNATNYEDQTVLQFMIASAFSSIHPNVTELVRKVINKGI